MKFIKVLLVTVFFTHNLISIAQITGEQTVLKNQTKDYYCSNCKTADAPNYGSPASGTFWADIPGAEILSSNDGYIRIKWNTVGTFTIRRMFINSSGTQAFRTLIVYVGDPYPDGNSIQGPHYVLLNSTEDYTCPTCYDGWSPIQDGYWTAVGGTIQGANNNKNAVSVKWTSLGTKTLKWGTDECGGSYCAFNTKTVYVGQLPSAPSSPIKYNLSCNRADLYSTNTPPSGTTWYWQRSVGTDESNPYSPGVNWVITDRGSGAFYLRAKSNFGWGGHVSLSISHSTWWHPANVPVAPDLDICEPGTVVLTSSSSSDKWYSGAGTYLHTGASYSTTINSNTTFFVEGVSEHGCVSTSKTQVDVTIKPVILKSLTGGGSICSGEETSIRLLNSQLNVNYALKNGSTTVSTLQGTGGDLVWTLSTAGTYTVTGTATYGTGCPTVMSGTRDIIIDEHDCMNYISEIVYKVPVNTANFNDAVANADLQTTYFDGLGRAIQSVNKQSLPGQIDAVIPFVYDNYNRQPMSYLPYGKGVNGHYKTDAIINGNYTQSDQYLFYQEASDVAHDVSPFSKKVFDASPLNRVIEQGSPGSVWQPINGSPTQGKTIKYGYEVNATNDGVENWDISGDLPVSQGIFSNTIENGNTIGQLAKTITTDEEGHQVLEFVDKQGQTILKRVQTHKNGFSEEWADTYYIYDDFGNLRFVLPPMANKKLDEGTAIDDIFLSQWCFSYKYDNRQRMIEKRVPGSDWVYMVYDDRDRLVLTQDGNQRDPEKTTGREWIFTKYDQLNRSIATGIYTHPVVLTQEQMQIYVKGRVGDEDGWYETYNGNSNLHGYTDLSFPTGVPQDDYLTITYYDNYSFKSLQDYGPAFEYDPTQVSAEPCTEGTCAFPSAAFAYVKGQVTGSKVKILDGSNTWLNSVSYYDQRYRLVQSITANYSGNIDKHSTLYAFSGWVLATKTSHQKGSETYGIKKRYIYDHAGRLMKGFHELVVNGQSQGEVLLAENKYNELGELIEKNLHVDNGTPHQSLDYRYNIRGWLESVNNSTLQIEPGRNTDDANPDLFGMELFYNHPLNGVPAGN